jgi:hypothetical protein
MEIDASPSAATLLVLFQVPSSDHKMKLGSRT